MKSSSSAFFAQARPIWLKGLATEMNIQAGFRAVFKAGPGKHVLRIAGATIYRIRLNGRFVGHGPARCGHGYYRVDEWSLPVLEGDNLVAIEVAGYNANGFAYLDQPSFLQAEVLAEGKVLAATGARSFSAYRLRERVRRVQRYSFQRPFVEAYNLSPRHDDWATKMRFAKKRPDPVDVLAPRKLVARGVPYPHFETRQPVAITASGTVRAIKNPKLRNPREWNRINPDYKVFPQDRKLVNTANELESLGSSVRSRKSRTYAADEPVALQSNCFKVLDLGTNLTGFIGMAVECDGPVDLYVSFDEFAMENGDVSSARYHCSNMVKYSLKPGCYELETLEPYTFKFLKLLAMNGSCRVSRVFIREYACPDSGRAAFACSDLRINELFEAARQTFRQNSVDVFMDCPGRERAGWLCDSFFTARAEYDLCGNSRIERNFFENYLLPDSFPRIVKGMLPMCYPSDHVDGWFIPNWAMWFVIQLEEYLYRSGDRALVDGLRGKVYGLIEYFKKFLNSDGLLEKLEKWVFLEWSQANKFTQDVSYPSNMVYAGMLEAAGMLYGDQGLIAQAESVRSVIRKQSFDGQFFVDNAVRKADGTLEVTRNRTETCQYYAFFFDIATPISHRKLWRRILTKFGPGRDPKRQFPDIHPSNAFIGFFLRMDVLSRYGENERILDQLYKNYLPMAETTGTLWEHKDTSASCNHGFASHVAHILYRDILGLKIDPVSRTVILSAPTLDLQWCEGSIPVENGWIEAKWQRKGSRAACTLALPAGWHRGG